MDLPEIKYRPSINPSVKELGELKQFTCEMYDLAVKDLGSLDRVDITYKSWIFRGKDGQRKFKRSWFGFPVTES